MRKYSASILQIGPLAKEFIDEGILVFFGSNAPEELQEFAILLDHNGLDAPIQPGDKLLLDEQQFTILAVGDVANENLANLGHLVVKFNGQTAAELPGDVNVAQVKQLPAIMPGTLVQIIQ